MVASLYPARGAGSIGTASPARFPGPSGGPPVVRSAASISSISYPPKRAHTIMLYLHGIGHFHPENEIDNTFLEALDIGTSDQ